MLSVMVARPEVCAKKIHKEIQRQQISMNLCNMKILVARC